MGSFLPSCVNTILHDASSSKDQLDYIDLTGHLSCSNENECLKKDGVEFSTPSFVLRSFVFDTSERRLFLFRKIIEGTHSRIHGFIGKHILNA